MEVSVLDFGVPKAGNADEEYEDASSVSLPVTGGGGAGGVLCRVAVADGAAGASFSGPWARLLCDAYVANGEDDAAGFLNGRLPDLGRLWKAEVDRRPLPWYAAEKARSGAFAALVGLTLREGGVWEAAAVGDCCLFQVRDDSALAACFPLTRPDDFGSSPALIGTFPADNRDLDARLRAAAGVWRADADVFYLMSDALAAWFLADAAAGGAPWRWFGGLTGVGGDAASFRAMVADLRSSGRLRNDDTTLVIVRTRGEEG